MSSAEQEATDDEVGDAAAADGGVASVVEARDAFVSPGLLRIILAFLANPVLENGADNRHQMASYLLDMKIFEMTEPISVSYNVKTSLGRTVTVKGRRIFRWERENRKLYMQRSDGPHGRITRMEMATSFGEEISQGLLYERVDLIPTLTDLLKVGFLVDFDEDEVEFLLRSKNLQLFSEDEDFIMGSFSSH
ncbi:unnamed protein product [Miscanthus lutarioriparius]|uniref:Uncharacterized protein n=1 Tax=Miscanthus lutarioriparius TaxID=422564 RepID=A0A811QF45_9POAL|nr:unnamed protein product [Miscanthus lutarioriparius]